MPGRRRETGRGRRGLSLAVPWWALVLPAVLVVSGLLMAWGRASSSEPRAADLCASDDLPEPLEHFPDAETAGVPQDVELTPVDGDFHTSSDGEVVERLDIDGRLYVDHDDVTVKCTRVRKMTVNRGENLRMWLSTLGDPNGVREGSALKWSDYTLRRVEIVGTFDGLKAEGDVDVQDSYIHDLYRTTDSSQDSGMTHNDGVQIEGGSDMVFKHNTFYGWSFTDGEQAGAHLLKVPFGDGEGYMTSAFMISAGKDDVENVLIQNNLIRGRTSKPILTARDGEHDIKDLKILYNVFGRESRDYPHLFVVGRDATVEGNVYVDGAYVED